ncbi:hypothetical protein AVEN_90270-1 [Araneus ventricosus]|uniref:Uncharacterized protein n=1 Tax=Araneus ventricosus TaxID=182803 RepID=A0A4Y2G1G5_ARAVE|nr:hypothetical protein AVEN_90270-1 [Araneus ventricosus]
MKLRSAHLEGLFLALFCIPYTGHQLVGVEIAITHRHLLFIRRHRGGTQDDIPSLTNPFFKCFKNSGFRELTCHKAHWLDSLPFVSVGIRTVLREDLNASAAELVYGSCLPLPGHLYEEKRIDQCPDYVARLQRLFRTVSRTLPLRHGSQRIYILKDLETCSHVFLRSPPFKKNLQATYQGSFKVVRCLPKDFIALIKGKERLVATDRLKPEFILNGSDKLTEQEHQIFRTRYGRRVKLRLPA